MGNRKPRKPPKPPPNRNSNRFSSLIQVKKSAPISPNVEKPLSPSGTKLISGAAVETPRSTNNKDSPVVATPSSLVEEAIEATVDLKTAVQSEPDLPTTNAVKAPEGSTPVLVDSPVMQASPESSPKEAPAISPTTVEPSKEAEKSVSSGSDSWANLVKGLGRPLKKSGNSFTLPTGEACVKIPNAVIERNKRSWDCFILGQFYVDPPSQGTIHNIVNGIWSKQMRDIVVSKMEGNAFLFRIPNASTRNWVLNQRLWQIDGKTMFVAKWDPGVVPKKPELTSAPIWLELPNVPFQFFNEEGLEQIASLVGDPKCLHPVTANKTILDVAKVFTIIDPRKPLPEMVNVQFDSGEIRKVHVSSPWMPPICSHCKGIGHSLKHCSLAPITCSKCRSTTHTKDHCPKANPTGPRRSHNQRRRRSRTPKYSASTTSHWAVKGFLLPGNKLTATSPVQVTTLGNPQNQLKGDSSGVGLNELVPSVKDSITEPVPVSDNSSESSSESEPEDDSSDVLSNNCEEEAIFNKLDNTQRKNQRGKSLKSAM